MTSMRKIGCTIQKLSLENNVSNEELATLINCNPSYIPALFKGLVYPSFEQLNTIAARFGVDIQYFIRGDSDYYTEHFVHCPSGFKNEDNKEKTLDLIYAFLDVREAALQ